MKPLWVEVVVRDEGGNYVTGADLDYRDSYARRMIADMVAKALASGGSVCTRALREDETPEAVMAREAKTDGK